MDLLGLGVMFDSPSSYTLTVQVPVPFQLLCYLLIDVSWEKDGYNSETKFLEYLLDQSMNYCLRKYSLVT